jgi:hypothetical protein
MIVPVMRVGHMGMAVSRWLVLVRMAVRALGHGVVEVAVMPVVVPVRVLVLHVFVLVLMLVRFGQVQRNAQQHQQAAQSHATAG